MNKKIIYNVSIQLLFFSHRYGVASTYYGISLNITGFGLNLYLTYFIYAAIEVPAKILVYISLKKIGRRPNQVGTLLLTGICIIINIVVPKGDILPKWSFGNMTLLWPPPQNKQLLFEKLKQ